MASDDRLPILLHVRGFKDRGGLPRSGSDANQHRQFQESLTRYLAAEGKGRYFLSRAPDGKTVQSVILEGELSRTGNERGGSYLCVLRVKDERSGRWVAQWAGVAENFRFLYGNLTGAQGVSPQGLVGELGGAVVSFLCGEEENKAGPVRSVVALFAAESVGQKH